MSDYTSDTSQQQLKKCSKCGEWKDRSCFHKKAAEKGGLYCQCKICVSEYTKIYNKNNKDVMRERSRKYREENPEYFIAYRKENKAKITQYRKLRYWNNRDKELAYTRKHYIDNHDHEIERRRIYRENNRELVRNSQRRHTLKNLEKERERKRLYGRNNPDKRRVAKNKRRARENNAEGFYTVTDMRLIYEQQQGLCHYCKEPLEWNKRHDEHKIPLSREGSNWPSNMAASCEACNTSKNDKTEEEFFEYLEKVKGLS